MNKAVSFLIFLIVMSFNVNDSTYSQTNNVTIKQETLLETKIENVEIKSQSIEKLFSTLSLSHDIPVGLEIGIGDDELASYSIKFEKGTVSDLLNTMIKEINQGRVQYDWKIDDGIINIFPKTTNRDPALSSILETTISHFSVKEKTDCWSFVESLVTTPDIKNTLQNNSMSYRKRSFSGGYIPMLGKDFKLNVSNITLKHLLNKTVQESSTAKIWLIKRNVYDAQTFFISLNARSEDFPIAVPDFTTNPDEIF